jgi:hypothetical protein
LETAGSVLNYFEAFLGRIEIMGSSHKIERVYFEILESNIEQWEKPQIKVKILFETMPNIIIGILDCFRNQNALSSTPLLLKAEIKKS